MFGLIEDLGFGIFDCSTVFYSVPEKWFVYRYPCKIRFILTKQVPLSCWHWQFGELTWCVPHAEQKESMDLCHSLFFVFDCPGLRFSLLIWYYLYHYYTHRLELTRGNICCPVLFTGIEKKYEKVTKITPNDAVIKCTAFWKSHLSLLFYLLFCNGKITPCGSMNECSFDVREMRPHNDIRNTCRYAVPYSTEIHMDTHCLRRSFNHWRNSIVWLVWAWAQLMNYN